MRPVLCTIVLCVMTTPVAAQWAKQPTPGIPRTTDGKANLTAPRPRAADGKTDLSGCGCRIAIRMESRRASKTTSCLDTL